jgi:tetratricopeptide (TPR) repeat protein
MRAQAGTMPAAVRRTQATTRIRIVCSLAVFGFSLALYLWTLAPTVTLVDSGELIVAVHTLGVAHPPGFPLYLLLAHLISLVPLGSVAFRVNFASAVFAALAVTATTLAVLELLVTADRDGPGRVRSTPGKRKLAPSAGTKLEAGELNWVAGATALTAGLLFCASRTLWSYATVAEVYTLNTFLIALIVFFLFRWRRRILEQRETARMPGGDTSGRPDRWLNAAALVFGLALGVHHVTVGLMLPAFAVLVLATEGLRFFFGRRLAKAAAWACAGLCIYIYLPIAAAREPLMNWGDPSTLGRFIAHVTGFQYRVFLESRFDLLARQLVDFFMRTAREFGSPWFPIALAAAAFGLGSLYSKTRGIFWFLAAAVLANLAYNVQYEIAEDKDAYYLPVFIMLVVAAAYGLGSVLESLSGKSWRGIRMPRVVCVLCLAAIPAVAIASNYAYDNRRNYFIARDYVENILKTVQPGAMLLTLDWQVYSPMFYLREMEGFRRDVVAIDINQLRRSWYFDYLERVYPATMQQARSEVDAFLEDLRGWEREPELYERDRVLNRRISDRFRVLILTLVANHARTAPVYVTQDIAGYPTGGPDSDWTVQIATDYQLVPEGLVFRLFKDQRFHEPEQPSLVTRGLVDGTIRFAADDVVMTKVLPVYIGMSYNLGRYLAAAGRHEAAIRAFQQALTLDPAFLPAQQAIAESQAALRRDPR